MTRSTRDAAAPAPRATTLVIAAMGGQGGGVLSNWIVDLAEHSGYLAQATSVPGVAQRTGATLYYLELFPEDEANRSGRVPVLALMPIPGEVDVVLAAELVEAGRAVLRGLVTPERTTLIASSHREYSVVEKSAMGDGITDGAKIADALHEAAGALTLFDMARVAAKHETLVSSVLLGALCGSGALPFARGDFEDAIRRSGIAPEASLRGFAAGHAAAAESGGANAADQSTRRDALTEEPSAHADALGESALPARAAELLERARADTPNGAFQIVADGLRRVVDHQDYRAGHIYLDLLKSSIDLDDGGPDGDHSLTRETARHLALWMSYEDAVRVADLKTRADRQARIRFELGADDTQVVHIVEFLHPGITELAEILPAPLGRIILERPGLRGVLDRLISRGQQISSTRISGFLLLWMLAGMRRLRRHSYRYQAEMGAIAIWLERVRLAAENDYRLAVEIARCQTLVKGYGDTHANGRANFDAIMDALPRITAHDPSPAERIQALRAAALAEEHGARLNEALAELPTC